MSFAKPESRRAPPPSPVFFRDLSSPISSSASRRLHNLPATSPPPPPPILSLSELETPSPEPKTPTPTRSPPQPPAANTTSWWSSYSSPLARSEEKEKEVVASPAAAALITLPPPREVARPELLPRDSSSALSAAAGFVDEEEWVTVYGYFPGDTNLVLREFEKCGIILRHIPGPRDSNWMHILYQSRYDAQKALAKHGQQLNNVLIIGVKPIDPRQRQFLNEDMDESYGSGTLVVFPPQPAALSSFSTRSALAPPPSSSRPNGIINGNRGASGAIASPAKSIVSKVMDIMFGL